MTWRFFHGTIALLACFVAGCASTKFDQMPKAVHQTEPEYPFSMRRAGLNGEVLVDFIVDQNGNVEKAFASRSTKPEFVQPALDAVRSWHFSPALKNGYPVPCHMAVPVVFTLTESNPDEMPKVLQQADGEYPPSMRQAGLNGEVLVDLIVDTDGHVQNAFASRSTNPKFAQPALDAVRKWHFSPARKNGRAVPCHIAVTMVFDLNLENTEAVAISDLPPELQKKIGPWLPELQSGRLAGHAIPILFVNAKGQDAHQLVVKAARADAEYALEAALWNYGFEPALPTDKPILTAMGSEHRLFAGPLAVDDAVQMRRLGPGATAADKDLLRLLEKHPERFASGGDLATPIRVLARHEPVLQADSEAIRPPAKALIDFVIDADGKVRIPRVESATSPQFGRIAVQALSSWEFSPFVRGTEHVMTSAQVNIQFISTSESPAAKAP